MNKKKFGKNRMKVSLTSRVKLRPIPEGGRLNNVMGEVVYHEVRKEGVKDVWFAEGRRWKRNRRGK